MLRVGFAVEAMKVNAMQEMPADLARRFGGLERLYGVPGAARIRAAHVVVVGIGGVGSWTAEALARSGVGRLTLIDMDHVSESNITRQTRACFISVGAAGGKRHAHKVDIDDLSLTTHDPLLALLRNRLRKEHGAPREGKKIGVACVFSREAVMPPDASCAVEGDGSLNCHGYGSVVSVTATFGQCAAGWVLDKIASTLEKSVKTTL
jgi:tRNA A37 threonylcarbamoyladenosine dehydratase